MNGHRLGEIKGVEGLGETISITDMLSYESCSSVRTRLLNNI